MRAHGRGLCVTLLLLSAAALAQSSQQEAGDTSEISREDRGPLKEKIPPVSGHFFLRKGRFELTPSIGFSFKDAFFTKYVLTGSLTYHASETVGVMLRGGYSLVGVSNAAQRCIYDANGIPTCGPPALNDIDGIAPGLITGLASLDVEWAPLYGKLSLIAEKVVHFDLYGIAGPTAIQYGGPRPAGGGALDTPTWTVGANVGVGAHFFLNRWMTLKAEVEDLIYSENVSVTSNASTSTSSLRNQFIFDLGISFFFPNAEEG